MMIGSPGGWSGGLGTGSGTLSFGVRSIQTANAVDIAIACIGSLCRRRPEVNFDSGSDGRYPLADGFGIHHLLAEHPRQRAGVRLH